MPRRIKTLKLRPTARPAEQRPSACQRGYDRHWQRIRAWRLAECPWCEDCRDRGEMVAANEVDHVIAILAGGTHDVANLRCLCKSCHTRKTNRVDGGLGNAKERS